MLFLHTSFFFLLCALTSVQARPLAAPSPFRDGIVLFEYPSGSEVEVESGNSLAKSPAPIIWEPETSQDDKDTDSNPPILARPGRERKHSGKSTHTKDPSKGHKGKKGHITKTKVVEVTRTVDDVGGIPVSTPCVTSTTTTVEVAPVPVEETTSTPCTKVEEIVETSTSTPCETSTTIAPVVEQPVPSSTPCETTEAPAPVEEPTSTSTPCDTTVTMIVVPIPVETTTTPCDTTTAIQAPVEETTSTPCNTTPVETTSTPCDTTTTQTPVEETTTTPLPITTVSEDPTSITTLPDSSTTTPESPSTTTIPTTESPTLTTTPTPPPPASTETVLPGEIPTLSFVLLPQESSSTTSDTFTIRPTPTAPLSPSSPTTTTTTTSSDSTTTPTTTTTPTLDSDNSITTPDAITQNPKLEIPTPIISNGNIDLDQFNDFLATQLAQTETNAAATQKPVACLGCGDTITRPIEGAGVGRGGMLMRGWLTGVVVVVGMVAMW